MKNLSKYIVPYYFDQDYFDQIYQNNPNFIKHNPTLLFKSIAISNSKAFIWLLNKIDIVPIFNKLIPFIFKNKRNLAHYKLIKHAYSDIFNNLENIRFVFNILFQYVSSDKIGKRVIKHMEELSNHHGIIDSFMLERLITQKQTHNLMIKHLMLGVKPNHINNFFAEYCKYGSVEHVSLFKDLGCDVHYLNDLALIKASEHVNEPMIYYLIDKENAKLRAGNYFCISSLLYEDEYAMYTPPSKEIILFLAKKIFNDSSIPKTVISKFLTDKVFNTAYQYFSVEKALNKKNASNEAFNKRKVNKV